MITLQTEADDNIPYFVGEMINSLPEATQWFTQLDKGISSARKLENSEGYNGS